MSNNPRWKTFQPPIMNSDPAILECKSMAIPSPKVISGTQPTNSYRNGTNYSGDFTDSPPSCGKNSTTFNNYSGAQTSPGNGTVRFPIGTFTGLEGAVNYSGEPVTTNNSYQSDQSTNQGTRETGIIEKLLHSYGFIQCCERQARLFFHFSQFSGNIEHLKIGDPVEFEMTYDRRTGKPIASTVSKIAPEVVLSEERVTGNVTTELQATGDSQGRISYENRGECFFLPYTKDDVEGNVTLLNGDKVSFQIATNQRGNLGACHIRFENPVHPVRYRGVVCSMKESYGFIERADVVKEIFFHFSEAKSMNEELKLGDDVEFIIQSKNGKEIARNITKLPPGSIIFEEINDEIIKGQILKPLERSLLARQSDPLPGRIRYRAPDHSEVEVSFGDKDQKGDFTLRHGDWVQFRIATDTRDQLKRATEISLLPESFTVSGERREQGVIVSLRDGYGFIRCAEREGRLFFHFNEVLDVDREICVSDEVEFTVIQDPSSSFSNARQSGIRLKHLPSGTVQFETIIESNVLGNVIKEISDNEPGLIGYLKDEQEKNIIFFSKDCNFKNIPKLNDKVRFNICQVKSNKKHVAENISLLNSAGEKIQNQNSNKKFMGEMIPGFIAALKDGFGFIETVTHDKEIFFPFSNFNGDASFLVLGSEVECSIISGNNNRGSGGCIAAEFVQILPKGSIPRPTVCSEVLDGTVTRPLRSANPEQAEYAGLIKVNPTSEEEETPEYEFGIMGLSNKRELLQIGDPVQFQLNSEGHACNIVVVRKKRRATVDAVKGLFGFLAYEVDEGKKLFFHMSEVCNNVKLQPGDQVEFVLVTNQRSGKSSACNVVRLSDAIQQQRPERLISLRTVPSQDSGPKLTVVRQPKGPDGTYGFSQERIQRKPGAIEE
ncbi:PREDICTED: cold shock domain-containing protein E1 [Ceratosolen solmsi marchali]|uniref:Cold shock domain-containing protein E1 n=1 Tax=Ceratosolen solmsi marchali TaxID=326594 RepID=A0AAJ6YJC2_9HYME|nr:PREDICTED: cold shock domain-containing protein E1 [Ceratosolen solmsi marchali]